MAGMVGHNTLSKFVHGTKLGELVDILEDCFTEGPGQAGEMH